MSPRISLGMPVYNAKDTVFRALESLLAQTWTDFELIISDNASTDGTFELLREYAARDPRIRLYRNSNNTGAVNNFKAVLGHARGEYFMWTAADDSWRPECLEALCRELDAHPQALVALSGVRVMHPDGRVNRDVRFQGEADPTGKTRLHASSLFMSSKKLNYFICGLMRRTMLQRNIRFFEMGFTSDRLFMCLMALAFPFQYVDEVLFEKTRQQPYDLRHKQDPHGRAIARARNAGIYYQPFVYLCKNIPRCADISWRNKLKSLALIWKSITFGIENTRNLRRARKKMIAAKAGCSLP